MPGSWETVFTVATRPPWSWGPTDLSHRVPELSAPNFLPFSGLRESSYQTLAHRPSPYASALLCHHGFQTCCQNWTDTRIWREKSLLEKCHLLDRDGHTWFISPGSYTLPWLPFHLVSLQNSSTQKQRLRRLRQHCNHCLHSVGTSGPQDTGWSTCGSGCLPPRTNSEHCLVVVLPLITVLIKIVTGLVYSLKKKDT